MNKNKPLFVISILISIASLMLAYALNQLWLACMFAFAMGLLGWYGNQRTQWRWSKDLHFTSTVILVIIGALLGLNISLLLIALLCGLSFWDLSRFQQRMNDTPILENIITIEKNHLILLGFALTFGGVLAIITLNFQIQLSFVVSLTLSVLLIIGLGQIYRQLRN